MYDCAAHADHAAAGSLLAAALARASPALARSTPDALPEIAVADLPDEAREVLALIRAGGPFRYERDGVVFGNRERLLPRAARAATITSTRCTRPARRTAARGVSSAAARQDAGRVLLHRRPLPIVREDPRMKAPDLADRRRRGRASVVGRDRAAARPPQRMRSSRSPSSTSRTPRTARRCSPSSTTRSSCPSTSATTSTRSPTCSRTATGSARAAA